MAVLLCLFLVVICLRWAFPAWTAEIGRPAPAIDETVSSALLPHIDAPDDDAVERLMPGLVGLSRAGASPSAVRRRCVQDSKERSERRGTSKWRLSIDAVRRVRRPDSPRCPDDRFVWVNTIFFGRHHNQLQELINIILWARTMNRTAVLSMFWFNREWHDPSLFYNFTRIMQWYCVVDVATFARQWVSKRRSNRSRPSYCLGQGVADTPMRSVISCRIVPGVPGFYDVRRGVSITGGFVHRFLTDAPLRDAPFLGLGGEIAFFMRAGLEEHAAIFGLLEPADVVEDRVRAMFASPDGASLLKPSSFTRSIVAMPVAVSDGGAHGSALREPGSYFAVHLRRREAECAKEMADSFIDGVALDGYFENVCPKDRRVIRRQCHLTADGVIDLLRNLQGQPSSYEKPVNAAPLNRVTALAITIDRVPLFVASDRQNPAVDDALRKQGAVFAPMTNASGSAVLADLSLDYFLLSHEEAAYFTGNQLSSVSQNVCYRRLGRGQACHGFHREFAEYHARNVAPRLFVPNISPFASQQWHALLREYSGDG